MSYSLNIHKAECQMVREIKSFVKKVSHAATKSEQLSLVAEACDLSESHKRHFDVLLECSESGSHKSDRNAKASTRFAMKKIETTWRLITRKYLPAA